MAYEPELEELLRRRGRQSHGTDAGLPPAAGAPENRGGAPDSLCGDPELLAAYAEGTLPAAARESFQAHLAACAACQTAVVRLVRLAPDQSAAGRAAPLPVASRGFRWRWAFHAMAGALLVGLFIYYEKDRILAPSGSEDAVLRSQRLPEGMDALPDARREAPSSDRAAAEPRSSEPAAQPGTASGGKGAGESAALDRAAKPAPVAPSAGAFEESPKRDMARNEAQPPAVAPPPPPEPAREARRQAEQTADSAFRDQVVGQKAKSEGQYAPEQPTDRLSRDQQQQQLARQQANVPAAPPPPPQARMQQQQSGLAATQQAGGPSQAALAQAARPPAEQESFQKKAQAQSKLEAADRDARGKDERNLADATSERKEAINQDAPAGARGRIMRPVPAEKTATTAEADVRADTGRVGVAPAASRPGANAIGGALGSTTSFRKLLHAGQERLALTHSGQIQKSATGSDAWRAVRLPMAQALDMTISGTHLWVLFARGRVAHSADLGTTWDAVVNTGIPDAVSVAFTSTTEGIIRTRTGDRWKTTDAGRTWQPAPRE